MLDVAAYTEHLDAVKVVQVVFEVKFVEVQGRDEGCPVGRGEGRTEESECEVGSIGWKKMYEFVVWDYVWMDRERAGKGFN